MTIRPATFEKRIKETLIATLVRTLSIWKDEEELDPMILRVAIEQTLSLDHQLAHEFLETITHDDKKLAEQIRSASTSIEPSKVALYFRQFVEYIKDTLLPDVNRKQGRLELPVRWITGFRLPEGMHENTELTAVPGWEKELLPRIREPMTEGGYVIVRDITIKPCQDPRRWVLSMQKIPGIGIRSLEDLYTFLLRKGFEPIFEGEDQ